MSFAINKLTEQLTGQMVNKVFIQPDHQFATEVKAAAIRTLFGAESETLNFTDLHRAAATINDWAQLKTRNVIKDLFGPDSLPADTKLVAVKASQFKTEWVRPFETLGITVPFRTADGKSEKNVEMMHLDAWMRYVEVAELDAKMVEFYYRYSYMKLVIILPNTINGLDDLSSKLNTSNGDEIMKRMPDELREKLTHVSLPILNGAFDYQLKEVLMNVISRKYQRIGTMFRHHLDTTQLSSDEVLVNKVVHKAVIEMNELDAEEAAATGFQTVPKSSSDSAEVYFNADHPFRYVWMDDETVIYVGDYVGA